MSQHQATYRFRELFDGLPQAAKKTAKEQIAQSLGVGVPHLNKIIREETDPSGQQLRVIAGYFDLTVDELFATTENQHAVA